MNTTANKKLNASFKILDGLSAQITKEEEKVSKIVYSELQKVRGRINITDITGPGHYFNEKVIKISKKNVFYCEADGKVASKYDLPPTFFRTFTKYQVESILNRIQEHIK